MMHGAPRVTFYNRPPLTGPSTSISDKDSYYHGVPTRLRRRKCALVIIIIIRQSEEKFILFMTTQTNVIKLLAIKLLKLFTKV